MHLRYLSCSNSFSKFTFHLSLLEEDVFHCLDDRLIEVSVKAL